MGEKVGIEGSDAEWERVGGGGGGSDVGLLEGMMSIASVVDVIGLVIAW